MSPGGPGTQGILPWPFWQRPFGQRFPLGKGFPTGNKDRAAEFFLIGFFPLQPKRGWQVPLPGASGPLGQRSANRGTLGRDTADFVPCIGWVRDHLDSVEGERDEPIAVDLPVQVPSALHMVAEAFLRLSWPELLLHSGAAI